MLLELFIFELFYRHFLINTDACKDKYDIIEYLRDVSTVSINSLTDDLTVNKITQQYKTSISCSTCVATNAVDRNINTCTRMEAIGTTSIDKSTWWYVDLGGTYNVYNIRVQFKDYGDMYSKYSNKQ